MAFSILVILAVSLIVFLVVRYEVVQGEAIVGSYEVDTCCRPSVIILIQVRASRKTGREFTQHAVSASPIVADTIAIFSIPLRPAGRKVSHLITAFTYVPRFSDEFHL